MSFSRRLWSLMKPYTTYLGLNILCNLLFVLFSFFSITLIAPFLALIFGMVEQVHSLPVFTWSTEGILQTAYYYVGQIQIHYGTMSALTGVAGIFVLSSFFSNLFRYLGFYFLTPIRSGVVRDLRNAMYGKILSLPLAYFSETRKGDMISRATADMNDIEWSIIAQPLQSLIKDPLNVLVFLIALVFISPSMALFVLLVFPITSYIISKIGKKLKKNAEQAQSRMGGVLSLIEESIGGLRIIKSFNLISLSLFRFDSRNQSYSRALNRAQQRRDLADPLTEFLAIIALALILWFGGNLVLKQEIGADILILFIFIFLRLISPAKACATAYYNLQKGRAALDRIDQVLNESDRIVDKQDGCVKTDFKKNIVYRNLGFSYSGNADVLCHIDCEIEKGKTIAIVGHSGSGKTTLVDLLPRFYDCTKGNIEIDGIDIRNIRLYSLRDMIGLVGQFPFLWNDTVENNIRFGNTQCTREQVEAAAKKAYAHDFIMEMPEMYDTFVGDLGNKLSGGQRQRIVIARAILKNAPILILDEATSALDTESEKYVQKALRSLMEGRTSIVIAHRLSTVRHADTILVMDKGYIMEKGTHQSLLEKNGLYAALIKTQL